MFCMHCGQELPSDASFCPNCGRRAEASSDDAPAAKAPPQANHVDGEISDELESAMNFALIITVLAMFSCGYIVNLILGIVAILHANKGNRLLESGDIEQAEGCAKTARTLCMIAVGVIAFQVLAVFFAIALMILFGIIPVLIQ